MSATNSRLIRKEIQSIKRSFATIARAFDRLGPALSSTTAGTSAGGAKSTRRRPQLTAAQRRALKLQGRYMGTMRGLSARARAKVKTIRRTKGIHAAIAEASRLATKSRR